MEKTRKCRGCGATLKADYRNAKRQHFCDRKGCQKLRRTLRQGLRRQGQRATQVPSNSPSGEPNRARRPQKASLISETDITAENPVIIGLISMITGSTNLEDIQATYRQLWIRGVQILEARMPQAVHNSDVINVFQAIQQCASQGD
jgi:hypothetical protein